MCLAEKHLRTELRQELGLSVYLFLPACSVIRVPCAEHGLKIDYFNQRRVLAEKQKPLLAQAAAQTAEARRS